MVITEEHRRFLLDAARQTIQRVLKGDPPGEIPQTTDPVLKMPAGCFVSLHDRRTHRLRGCVGRLQTPDPLIKTIHETAQSALEDPRFRFDPVTLAELFHLELEVSILSPLEPAANPLDFDPPNDGICLICDGRSGTFLPQVARETGWTREQLLTRLCTEKMGLSANAWRNPAARLLKYKTVLIGPVPFVERTEPAAVAPQPAARVGSGFFGANQVFKL